MKFFAISSALLLLKITQQASDCGMGKVANINHICIEPEFIEGCKIYKNQTSCFECQTGYQINTKGQCDAQLYLPRLSKISGCLKRDPHQNSKCSNCAEGYILSDGVCEEGVKNCKLYNIDRTCKECKKDHSLILNTCLQNPILGCRQFSSSTHLCYQCQMPFKLNQNKVCFIQNCKDYNDYGCTTCECGHYLDQDRSCRRFKEGCLRYQRGKCINCFKYYKLKGNICEIQGCIQYEKTKCKVCRSQYQQFEDGCIFKDCVDWANDQCLSCKQGFKNQKGICVKEDPAYCQP